MPALPDVAGVVRCAFNHLNTGGRPAVSRMFVHYSGTPPTAAQMATFAAALDAAWNTDLAPITHASWTLESVVCEDLTSSSGAVGAAGTTHVGTLAGGNLPGQVALVMSYLIARRYRGGHPRGYWPFGDDTKVNNDVTWLPAFLTTVGTNWNAFVTAVLAAGWTGAGTLTHANVSYYSGFTVVTNPITHRARNVPTLRGTPLVDTITGYVAEPLFGTQRRRVRG